MSTDRGRTPLTRERLVEGAVELADEIGIEALTMRKLAAAVGVKPMSLYHHFPDGKEQIVDAMVDTVFDQIELPPDSEPWQAAIRVRCVSAREVLNRHPWAPPIMESRTSPGPASLRHHDAVIACFRNGGLTIEMTAHAYAILDSYVYGFTLQEANLPHGGSEELGEIAEMVVAALPVDQYPYFAELATHQVMQPGYSFGSSFDVGLDLLISGLAREVDGR